MKNNFVLLFILLFILILISLGIIVRVNYNIWQGNNNNINNNQKPKETNDPFDNWGGKWKTYYNKKYHFKVKYPGYLSIKGPEQIYDNNSKPLESISFVTKLKNGEFVPYHGGMAIIIQENIEALSSEEWFQKNKDRNAPFSTLVFEKKTKVNNYDAVIFFSAEKGNEAFLPPAYIERTTVFIKEGILFTINGSSIDLERVRKSFRFVDK